MSAIFIKIECLLIKLASPHTHARTATLRSKRQLPHSPPRAREREREPHSEAGPAYPEAGPVTPRRTHSGLSAFSKEPLTLRRAQIPWGGPAYPEAGPVTLRQARIPQKGLKRRFFGLQT